MENNARMKAIAQLLAECNDEELDKLSAILTPADRIQKTVGEAVDQLLLELGVPDALKGYRCLQNAIAMTVEDPSLVDGITSRLYPEVAKVCDTSGSKVERAIRHAIEAGWDRCDLDTIMHYFGNTISPNKGKPTNGEFVARAANIIRKQVYGK